VSGRSVHDALLRALTSADLRRRLHAGEAEPLGAAEATVLRAADGERLARLARFMGRHFYRERIVRLFAGSRVLARRRGQDPLRVIDTPAFDALLEGAEVGSAETAERVAALVETALAAALGEVAYGRDLVAYEGALFRAEAGPRRWTATGDGAGEVPARSAHARVCALDWDVSGLVAAVRRGEASLPEPACAPTRLLIAMAPGGRVTTVRCPETVERLLSALDGARSTAEAAAVAGVTEADAGRLLGQLTEVGAVEWRERGR
jgi:hypothetical protein